MSPAAFKTKWQRFSGKETAAYQEHFNDLCHLLRLPTPAEADPTGNDTFCFQKYVLKGAFVAEFPEDVHGRMVIINGNVELRNKLQPLL